MAQRDIIELIRQDHQEVRTLLSQIDACTPGERGELFQRVAAELARHEAAEEAIVHRTLRDDVEDGAPVAESVLDEESEAEQLMADMEKLDAESEEFLTAFQNLRDEVLAHAEHEEREEHPRLRAALDADRLREMAERFEKVKEMAPTHPHPKTPQTPEVRAAAAPVAGMFDRMRDKVDELVGS